MFSPLFNDLQAEPKALVITANERLARYLRSGYEQKMQQQGALCWNTPLILSLDTWLKNCYQDGLDAGFHDQILLQGSQTRYLWQQLLSNYQLVNPIPLARLAEEAWELTQHWHIPLQASLFSQREEHRVFLELAHQFKSQCQQHHWLDNARLGAAVMQWFKQCKPTLPPQLQLVGFYSLDPSQQQLFDELGTQGCTVSHYPLKNPAAIAQKIALSDTEEELYTMAAWAHQLHQQQPQASIGCIVLPLESMRPLIDRIFKEFFHGSDTFNLSGGKPLNQVPLIHTAIELLDLNRDPLSLVSFGRLLHSPYIGQAETEMTARSHWDNLLRKDGNEWLHYQDLCHYPKKIAPFLQTALTHFSEHCRTQPPSQAASAWALAFHQQLALLGWPGERSLNSEEYQAHQQWLQLLEQMATMDLVCPLLTRSEALFLLTELAQSSVFQIKTENSRVQVLGMLEAVDIPFDYAWVTHLHGGTWPPPAKPNPFLPIQLQQQHEMPHASAEREFKFCTYLMGHLQQSVKELIYSYPQYEGDQELLESPLIKSIPLLSQPPYIPSPEIMGKSESIRDIYGPPIVTAEITKGGTALFKEQGACAFRAFAKLRLGAASLPEVEPGLSKIEQGTLIHELLEYFWNSVGDYATLISFAKADLDRLLDTLIHEKLNTLQSKRQTLLKPKFFQLEHQRLKKLLRSWVDYEIEHRTVPFTVIAQEQASLFKTEELTVHIKLDRLDKLDDGSYCLIDYKTGKISPQSWFGERPDEPQLLLYCLASEYPVQGLLFASIRSDELKFKGITTIADRIVGIKTFDQFTHPDKAETWEEQLLEWRQHLENLAAEYQSGFAAVNPKDDLTCQHCDLQSLCRIYESDSTEEDAEI